MKNLALAGCALFSILIFNGCTPTKAVRGNILQDYQIQEVKAGIDTRSDVLHKLGSPTTQAPFDENVWYYLGQTTEKRGILDPEVTEERVVVVLFNDAGIVEAIEDVDNQRIDLPYARDKTPTTGNEITAVQQLLGNLGRFNRAPEEY